MIPTEKRLEFLEATAIYIAEAAQLSLAGLDALLADETRELAAFRARYCGEPPTVEAAEHIITLMRSATTRMRALRAEREGGKHAGYSN